MTANVLPADRLTLTPDGPVQAMKVYYIEDTEQLFPDSGMPARTYGTC
jgi:hypothetical protein